MQAFSLMACSVVSNTETAPTRRKLLLYGASGTGKSSFVNCVSGRIRKESHIAAEAYGKSGSTRTFVYVLNHPELGDLSIMDSVGLNGTDGCTNEYINTEILQYCYRNELINNDNYQLDAILYFCPLTNTRMNFERDLTAFCRIFKTTLERVMQSVICVFTFASRFQDESDDINETISQLNTANFQNWLLWDSKKPLENQTCKLQTLLNNVQKFTLSTCVYDDEIQQIALTLQFRDQIPLQRVNAQINTVKEKKEIPFVHTEEKSGYGIWSIPAFGITQLLPKVIDIKSGYLVPNYPDRAFNCKITAITPVVKKTSHVDNYSLEAEYKNSEDGPFCSGGFKSTIEVPAIQFGNGKIEYSIQYEYQYQMLEQVKDVEYVNKYDVNYYIPFAKEQYFHKLFDVIR